MNIHFSKTKAIKIIFSIIVLLAVSGGSIFAYSKYFQPKPKTNCQGKIKGNISSKDEKIYHTPRGRYYDKTDIIESSGERWFCTEDEAKQAGWRKSKD